MSTLELLALGPFANPIMLAWLAAATAPIVIHLLSKRRYREHTWAAMQFLIAAIEKNSRRIRIEQWILLAVRTLLLILLAAALAEPMLGQLLNVGQGLRGGVTHWVIVLDASYSMDYRDTEQSAFERAKELAGKLASEAVQGDGFTLVLLSDPPTVVIREPAFDSADVARELEVLSVRHGGADLPSTLGEVEKLIDRTQEEHPRLQQHRICVFSDLGANTWESIDEAAARRLVASLGEKATLQLFDVGQDGRDNAAVVGLNVDQPVITPGREVRLTAEVQKFGGPNVRRRMGLYVDGRRVAEQSISIANEDVVSATFKHRFQRIGDHAIEVRMNEDMLPLDDARWLSFSVRDSVRVLCIEGKPRAARFVSLALSPNENVDRTITTEIAAEPALIERDLSEFDCLFICNVGRMGREESTVLREYVAQGGAVVIFLGDQVDAATYNQWLGPREGRSGLLPAKIGDAKGNAAQYGFNPLEYQHPLVASFRGHEEAGLLTTPVWKYFQLTPDESLGAKTALAFDSGAPAIVEAPIDRGRVVLCATAASTASLTRTGTPWTAWATWPSFPPVVQEMLRLAIARRWDNRNVKVGQPLIGVATDANLGDAVVVQGPPHDGRDSWNERIPLSLQGDHHLWSFTQTLWAGVYEAAFEGREAATPHAVNVDPSEGDLRRLDPSLLPDQFLRSEQSAANDESLIEDQQQPYFRHLLVAMVICLVAESLLAWRFGSSG